MRSPKIDVYAYTMNYIGQPNPIIIKTPPILLQYVDLANVGSKKEARTLAEHSLQNLAIKFVLGATALTKLLYNLLIAELEVLRKYIIKYLNKRSIRKSIFLASVLILFTKKKDISLRLYIDN